MPLTIRREDDVLYLTLDAATQGNRLDADLVAALTAEYEGAAPLDGGPAAILLTAAGPDFCLGRARPAEQSDDPAEITAEFARIQRMNEAVQRCRAVTLCAAQGRCEGAGLSLAARHDILLVADDAQLCFPEIRHGIPPTIVLSHFRYVLPRNLMGDLIYAGRAFPGAEAVGAGLAARSLPATELESAALALARDVAAQDRRSVALVKSFLAQTEAMPAPLAPGLGISLYANEIAHRLRKS